MFKMDKRNGLILSLMVILFIISYFNYAVNKYSILETSTDFEKYEENKLSEIESQIHEDIVEEVINQEAEDSTSSDGEIRMVNSNDNQIEDIVVQTSTNIETSITSNKNMKSSNYFIEARLNTNIEREKLVALLNEIIGNERTDEANRKAANDEKMKLVDIISKEKIIENLVKAKGFEEALVFITDNSVNVIVQANKLEQADVAKILDIVMRETKVAVEDIKIHTK